MLILVKSLPQLGRWRLLASHFSSNNSGFFRGSSPSRLVNIRLSGRLFEWSYLASFVLLMQHSRHSSFLTPALPLVQMFVFISVQLILNIVRRTHISNACIRLSSSFLSVHDPQPHRARLQTRECILLS